MEVNYGVFSYNKLILCADEYTVKQTCSWKFVSCYASRKLKGTKENLEIIENFTCDSH